MGERQCTNAVLMVRPCRFESNPQTAPTNSFQVLSSAPSAAGAQVAAAAEFDGLVTALRGAGITVVPVEDEPEPWTPDAIFPNNWFSTHADGRAVLYPMLAPNRRAERRQDIFADVLPAAGYRVDEIVDLSASERRGAFLEGTGSLVLDRVQRVAYGCRSSRTHQEVAQEFAEQLGYALELFDAADPHGHEIYHSNVLMSVGERLAVICAEALELRDRRRVMERLAVEGREVLTIDQGQMGAFAGNVLELIDGDGEPVIAMSQAAWDAFTGAQQALIERCARPVWANISTIETCSGGSVRCMLAEIHLPQVSPGS